jgi:hypothetical protein
MTDADRFRDQAEECREQAERSLNPLDKELGCVLRATGSSWPRPRKKDEIIIFGPAGTSKAASVGGPEQ